MLVGRGKKTIKNIIDKTVYMKIKLKYNILDISSAYYFCKGPESTTIQFCPCRMKTARTMCKQNEGGAVPLKFDEQ